MKKLLYVFALFVVSGHAFMAAALPAPVMPEGSYGDTCTGCTFNTQTRKLTCRCQRNWCPDQAIAEERESSLVVPRGCKNVRNVDGKLKCQSDNVMIPQRTDCPVMEMFQAAVVE